MFDPILHFLHLIYMDNKQLFIYYLEVKLILKKKEKKKKKGKGKEKRKRKRKSKNTITRTSNHTPISKWTRLNTFSWNWTIKTIQTFPIDSCSICKCFIPFCISFICDFWTINSYYVVVFMDICEHFIFN